MTKLGQIGGFGGALAALLVTLPVQALQIKVLPQSPALGDTVQVEVTDSTAPTVSLNGRNYPAFVIGPNRWRALLPTSPLDRPGALRIQASNGSETQQTVVNLRARQFPTQRIWLSSSSDGPGLSQIERDRVAQFKATVSPERFWSGLFQRPSQGEISTVYGVQRYYNGQFAQDYYHRGVDYAAATGTPVVAPAAGRVVLVGRESQGFRIHGNCVGLDHGQGVLSIFMHLSRVNVQEGQMVQPGQTIGAVGSTGASTGPHLHWGLYVNGVAVDPVPWRYGYDNGGPIQ
ncbi:M23 family metallopeptidase [Leptolyngbya sp. FACHB-261]|uniref:M23 family metallopeptidase n=1 Tax=Leptolyngbya sp. FACHB-261 TaxID=2692806 RepID=UPI001682A705|nr:M23 family metallopeptidase [Leptolyngbya sp. FACHB-261]MBD2102241.1 M23 family metallopeptidase [Leptolyngbya sp. FACHB-261]